MLKGFLNYLNIQDRQQFKSVYDRAMFYMPIVNKIESLDNIINDKLEEENKERNKRAYLAKLLKRYIKYKTHLKFFDNINEGVNNSWNSSIKNKKSYKRRRVENLLVSDSNSFMNKLVSSNKINKRQGHKLYTETKKRYLI